MEKIALQDKYGPNTTCHGCGPANEKGFKIKSHWEGDKCVLRYTPDDHHQAMVNETGGIVNGGVIGILFDCHMNWTAASALYKSRNNEGIFPSTVTGEFTVKLKAPTPLGVELVVYSVAEKIDGRVVHTSAEIYANDVLTATSTGIFIEVKEGHPAFQRWG